MASSQLTLTQKPVFAVLESLGIATRIPSLSTSFQAMNKALLATNSEPVLTHISNPLSLSHFLICASHPSHHVFPE